MDAVLSRLPLELVLLVVEHAARDQVLAWTSWVAVLCLVCKKFRRVVTPILYAIITVTENNCDRLTTTSCLLNTPLCHTTTVICVAFDHWSNLRVPLTLLRALVNLSSFTGSTAVLANLLVSVHAMNLLSAHLTDVALASEPLRIAAVASVSRLHIDHEIRFGNPRLQPDLSSSKIEYLVIDLFSEASSLEDEVIDLSPITPLATSSPRLRRVLFRPRCAREPDAQRVARAVVEWAHGRRDQRIYVDDTFVPIADEESEWRWEDLDKQDALDGDSLWFRGRQVGSSSSRRRQSATPSAGVDASLA